MDKRKRTMPLSGLTYAALTAALYVALTLTPPLSSLSFGAIQLRVSEALCVLPFLFPQTAPGVILGCLISNLFSPNILPLDLILGTAATALGVFGTLCVRRLKGRFSKWLAPLFPVVANALIVPVIICLSTPAESFLVTYFSAVLSVGAGEILACYGLGIPLLYLFSRFGARLTLPKEDDQ